MIILLTKLISTFLYPVGVFCVLVLLATVRRLLGGAGKGKLLIGLAIITIIVCSTPKFAEWAASTLEQQYPVVAIGNLPNVDTMIVLGGSLAPPVPPRLRVELESTSDRLLHAARIYREGKAKRILLSGGQVFPDFDNLPESHHAKSLLIEWGVPENVIFVDGKSKTTYENAIQSRNFLSEKGWINKPVILVTSALHMPRSIRTFEAANINVTPSVTDILVVAPTKPRIFQWLPTASALQLTTVSWHEWLGLWLYQFRGWAFST